MFLFKRDGIYYLEYTDEIENRKKRISTKSHTKPEALKFLTDFKAKLNERAKVKYISLDEFTKEYCSYVKTSYSLGYHRTVKSSFNLLKEITGDIPIIRLNNRLLEQYFLKRFNETQVGAHHDYRNLRAAFNKAITWKYLTENPLNKVKLPKMTKSFPVFIGKTELESILKKIENKDLHDFYLMAFHTGMRREELRLLRWASINFNERIITIQNTDNFTTKNKKERIIPINDTLLAMLNSRIPTVISMNRSEYVFSKFSNIPYSQEFISKSFKKTIRGLNLDDKIHLHTLRHSAASAMVQNGVSLYVVKEILGHEDLSTTQIYAHLQRENLTQAMKALDQAI